MPTPLDNSRPRAGRGRFRAALALLALAAMFGLSLATSGHHHGGHEQAGPVPHDHGDHGDHGVPAPGHGAPTCPYCLWQAHQAADLAPPVDVPGPGSGRLAAVATAPRAVAAATPAPLARAPPRTHA